MNGIARCLAHGVRRVLPPRLLGKSWEVTCFFSFFLSFPFAFRQWQYSVFGNGNIVKGEISRTKSKKAKEMRKHGGGKTAPDYPQGQGRKVMVYLEPLTIQLVKKMAEKGGMSQSEAVRNCIRNE